MGSMGGGPPSIGLDLGLGPGFNHGNSGFTLLQLQELEHQALIFKYMHACVPVPLHLIFPIWKSVVSSYTGVNGGSYHHYPSFLGCSTLCFDYRNNMEPEPGRCRRTDGKKWRCSKDVVPDQKYCERHMHRGRKCSRKLVETPRVITSSTSAAVAASNNNVMNSNTDLSISAPVSLQLMPNSNSNNDNNTNTNSNNINVSPRLPFSPKSVLHSGTYNNKTESSK